MIACRPSAGPHLRIIREVSPYGSRATMLITTATSSGTCGQRFEFHDMTHQHSIIRSAVSLGGVRGALWEASGEQSGLTACERV
jgi:hypothetical protein